MITEILSVLHRYSDSTEGMHIIPEYNFEDITIAIKARVKGINTLRLYNALIMLKEKLQPYIIINDYTELANQLIK